MHSDQSHSAPLFPIGAKQLAHNLQGLSVELGGALQRPPARVGGEVGVAQLELHLAGVQLMFAQTAAHHLSESRQHGFQHRKIAFVAIECVFVADGLGIIVGTDLLVVPSTGIVSTRLFDQRCKPVSNLSAQSRFGEACEVADGANAALTQSLLGDLAHTGQAPHIERCEKALFQSRQYVEHTVGFGLFAGNLGDHTGGGDADRTVQPGFALHRFVQ